MIKLRPYFSLVAIALVALVGIWLAAPRDVCLTKLVSNSGCICVTETNTSSDCSCCASNSDLQDRHSTEHDSGCFSISSQDTNLISHDRANDVVAMDTAVAVIPLSVLLVERVSKPAYPVKSADMWQSGQNVHRDNCVYLI